MLLRHRPRMKLPINSDIEVARSVAGVSVMIRILPRHVALAAVGGALGTAARFGVASVAPAWETLSSGTVTVNLVGPFLLGALLQHLSEGSASRARRIKQLLMGGGFLGAFTSYAQLAVDTVSFAEQGQVWLAVAYALGTIVAGAAAAWLGIVSVSHRRRSVHR